MTEHSNLKRLIRDRQARTGESYMTARRHIVGDEPRDEPQDTDVALRSLIWFVGNPRERFGTVRATFRTWRDEERSQEARRADTEKARARGGSVTSYSIRELDPLSRETAEITHVWREGDRLRVEIQGGARDGFFGVRDGDAWWSWDPRIGSRSNAHDLTMARQVNGQPPFMLDPERLVTLLGFRIVGDSQIAERATRTVHATPLAPNPISGVTLALYSLGAGANHYTLEVDQDRGVLLACTAFFKCKPIQSITAEEIRFDEPISPDRFVFEAPEDEISSS